jgi:hypothetical protein
MKYDLEYYENMLRQYSATAEQICKIRWEWISEADPKTVLDYGCGCGWFRAWRPKGVEVHTYDIGGYPQTGIELKMYDVVCFWDVLEHILDFRNIEPILALSRYVAATIPLVTDDIELYQSKHFKPSEHLHFYKKETLDALMKRYGFELVKKGTPECPPRVEITSVLYAKNHS